MRKKILLLFAVLTMAISASAENYILYTSSDGKVVTPKKNDVFGATILSNTYEDGQGKIVFDGEVTSIGNYAFHNCSKLTSVEIPNSVTSIGGEAFSDCSSLTSVEIPNSVTSIEGWAFSSCYDLRSVTIPNSVTEIKECAFCYCKSLTSVVIPNSVTKIGETAFWECSNLTSVVIPNSVSSIGYGAFRKCTSLTSVVIPNSVTSIGAYAFEECSSLISVEIPNSVTEIRTAAFSCCSSLLSFTGKFASEDNRCLIVDGVLISFAPIGLTNYEIPNSVTSIGDYAFSLCSNLTSVTIPNSVTSIGERSFYDCSNLTSIVIPNSVSSIGNEAFMSCMSLNEIFCPNPTPLSSLGADCFSGVAGDCVIRVPASAVATYKTSWSDYASQIQAISTDFIDDGNTPYTYNFSLGNCNITYTRTFSHTGWQAIFLPFSMNYDVWKDYGTLASLTNVSDDGVLEWETWGEGTATKAGKPFIFKPNAAGTVTFIVNNRDLESCESIYYDSYNGYTLSGTYTEKTNMASTHAYALYKGNFYYSSDATKTLKPYRIFLTAPASTPLDAPIRSRINGMDVTGIEGIDVDIDGQQQINLFGQPVGSDYKGIVIVNGKKVIR